GATNFNVGAPENIRQSSATSVHVTAAHNSNNVATGFAGTVHFTSSSTGTLPADYTFVAGDNGVHTFSVTLTTNGAQSVTATSGAINGSANTTVNAAAIVATKFNVVAPANVTQGD